MTRRCCVLGCQSNCKSESHTNRYSFPKDPELRLKWEKTLHREGFVVKNSSVVCIKHFEERFIERDHRATRADGTILIVPRKNPVLIKGAYPTIFVGQPAYLTAKLPAKRKTPNERVKKKSKATNSPKKEAKNKKKKLNHPPSQQETVPSTESSAMHAHPSTSSLLDPNIIIKQEIIETHDEVPSLDLDNLKDTLLQPEMIKQEKSPNPSVVPPTPPLIGCHSTEPSDGERIPDFQSDSYKIIRVGDSDVLLSTKALETATYNIVNFSTNAPKTASSSCSATSVKERTVSDSNACFETLASTSVDGKVKDQFDAYGEYIAAKLRKLDPKSCAYVQKAFGEIIFEAEMGKFL